MSRLRYIPNLNYEEDLVQDDEYVNGLKAMARDVRDRAFYLKHKVMPNKEFSQVEVVEVDGRVYVANTDYGGHIDEYGSANSTPYAPLRTAVRAAGFRLEEESE